MFLSPLKPNPESVGSQDANEHLEWIRVHQGQYLSWVIASKGSLQRFQKILEHYAQFQTKKMQEADQGEKESAA